MPTIGVDKDFADQVSLLFKENGFSPLQSVLPIPCGGNNQVYKIQCGKLKFLLKRYFSHPEDHRNRLETEFTFLTFCWNLGIRSVPQPLIKNENQGIGVYEFIEGRQINPEDLTENHIQRAVDFCISLNEHREVKQACHIKDASEACFTLMEHLNCVSERLKKLKTISKMDELSRAAFMFITADLLPAWERVKIYIHKQNNQLDLAMGEILPAAGKCLSPSDFGFHNAILVNGDELKFIDFEYAGWDDPAKLVCDFFCQPKVPVDMKYFSSFTDSISSLSFDKEAFREKCKILLPVYKIKWCCIMLNDFLVVDNNRRSFAKQGNSIIRKQNQLIKAKQYFKEHNIFNY